jgi:hypothetical protein
VRRRPQPSRRRGLLRAALVVIVLTALLLAALLVVSTLLAPSAKAPTQTVTIPTPPLTPARPTVTTPKPTRPTATPVKKKKDVSLAPPVLSDLRPHSYLTPRSAYFEGHGGAYGGITLRFRDRLVGASFVVGQADPFVRPVWSRDYGALLYVRVRSTSRYPGALWTLLRYSVSSHRSVVVAHANAMQLAPLGWAGGGDLYLVATSSDTSIYQSSRRGKSFISMLMPQPITSGVLSPDGKYLAFTAPGSCSYCTLDIFDLSARTTWNGPSGMTSEYQAAWSSDSHYLVTLSANRLAAIDVHSHEVSYFTKPSHLPSTWSSGVRAIVSPRSLTLLDGNTGRAYSAQSTG